MASAHPFARIEISLPSGGTFDTAKFTQEPVAVRPTRAPRNLEATGGPSAGQISLNWEAPVSESTTYVTNYRIYRGTATGGPYAMIVELGDVRTHLDSDLLAETYYYRVAAKNGAGEGPLSNEASSTNGPTNPVPGKPQLLKAGGASGENSIRLSWKAPLQGPNDPAIDHYVIGRNHHEGVLIGTVPAGTPPGIDFSWQDATSVAGTAYIYWVYAVTEDGVDGLAESVDIERGQTAYVLVHGVCSGSAMWTEDDDTGYLIHNHLSSLGPVWTPSYHANDYPNPTLMEAYLRDFIRSSLELDENNGVDHVVVVGHSLGGLLARTLPLETPELKIARIVSLDSPDRGLDDLTTNLALDKFGCGNDIDEQWDSFIRRCLNSEGDDNAWLTPIRERQDARIFRMVYGRCDVGEFSIDVSCTDAYVDEWSNDGGMDESFANWHGAIFLGSAAEDMRNYSTSIGWAHDDACSGTHDEGPRQGLASVIYFGYGHGSLPSNAYHSFGNYIFADYIARVAATGNISFSPTAFQSYRLC